MSEEYASNRIDDFIFADGSYTVFLGLKQIAELQEKCKAGISAIHKRMILGDWYAEDCYEIIRLGLIGGALLTGQGPSPTDAMKLVQRYVETRPLDKAYNAAIRIIDACMVGFTPPDEDKKKDEVTTTATAS